MNYLVDGHNLIAMLPGMSLDDPDDEAKLIIRLRRWAAGGSNRKISVFFDGGLPGGQEQFLSSPTVDVIFASAGTTADELIINRIVRAQNPVEFALVSDDRVVKKAAAIHKIRTISAKAFAMQLEQKAGDHDDPESDNEETAEFKQDPSLNDQEISEWLELFTGTNLNESDS